MVGASATCATSTSFKVITKRDGYEWSLEFKNGLPQSNVAEKGKAIAATGTKIIYTPNKAVFHLAKDEPCFDSERIRNELELTSYFLPCGTFIFNDNGKQYTYYSENGIKDFAKTQIENPLHSHEIYGYKQFEDDVEVEILAQWTKSSQEKFVVLSNGAINVDGGTPVQGAKTGITRTMNSLGKMNLSGDIVRKGLSCIINIKHPKPIYQNQIKSRIQNPELAGYTQKVFGEALKDWYTKSRNEFDKVVELIAKEDKAERAAERARKQILEATNDIEKNQRKKTFSSDKLKDAEFLGNDSTLLIVEGDSAAGAIAKARDYEHYGILAIRGI